MNLYFLGILAALVVFFAVGIAAGRMVKDTNDYYVSGRNAPTLLIVGSLIASFLSTAPFSATRVRSTPAFSSAS